MTSPIDVSGLDIPTMIDLRKRIDAALAAKRTELADQLAQLKSAGVKKRRKSGKGTSSGGNKGSKDTATAASGAAQ